MLTIGKLSTRTGVKVPTIRYYEQTGLMDEPGRTAANQRRYGQGELERLAFIKHARDLGFSISAIADLIRLQGRPDQPCDNADEIARGQLAEVRGKIKRLKRLERELARISAACACEGAVQDCAVLAALGDHDQCGTEH
jgi:DNA-binding transcriptional MerR regulator